MSDYKQPAIATSGVQLEEEHALIDARDYIWERGKQIKLRLHSEQKITRDKFNSIIKRDLASSPEMTFYAYPVTFNPTDKEMEESGIREKTQVIIYTAMFDWNDNDYSLETLKKLDSIRMTVIIDCAKYEIRDKALNSQFSNTYLYVVLGLNRI